MTANYIGFWGAPNSIIDFCEANYVVSHYFAEFFNALSSVPMIFQAILGLLLTHKFASKETRFKLCYISLVFVGFGSTLFHSSLQYKYQLLDELPMLVSSTMMLYCALTIDQTNTKCIKLIAVLLTILCVEFIMYVYFQIWAIFFIGYAVNIVFVTFYGYKYYVCKFPLAKKIFMIACMCYYVASICWFVDMGLCDYVQVLHLHSFWHLGAGYGSYLSFLVMIIIRSTYLKKKPKVYMFHASELFCKQKTNHVVIDIPLCHYCHYHPIDT